MGQQTGNIHHRILIQTQNYYDRTPGIKSFNAV
jgi:hypothetical protein